MRKKIHEIMGVPPEYQNGGMTEYPEPPDEFNRFAPPAPEEEKPSRTRRILLLLAALGVISFGIFWPTALRPILPVAETTASPGAPTAEASLPPVTEVPRQTEQAAETAPAETPAATPVPTATTAPTATPEPTPKPTPYETPGVEVIFFRQSQVYTGFVWVSKKEEAISAELKVYDPDIEQAAIEHTFTPEELASGFYKITDYEPYDFYFEHSDEYNRLDREPELVMQVTAVYRTEAGEETLTGSCEAQEEIWVDFDFDSEEDRTILEMLYGTVYPDCFVIRVLGVPIEDLQLLLNADESELEPGGISVSISVDGVTLTGEDSTLSKEKYMYGGQILYDYVLLIPRPDTIPAHGTAHYSILQRLIHFNSYQTKERDKDY